MTQALLLVDIQNDYFPGGAFPLPGIKQAASKAADVLAWARRSGIRIIHIRHEDIDPSGEFFLKGTPGAEINGLVAPQKDEKIITKHFPNSFRETRLVEELPGVEKLVIVGAMSKMCIDATARAAFDLGYQVVVVEDACAASDLKFNDLPIPAGAVHGAFMAALGSVYGEIVRAEEVMKEGL